MSRLLQRKAICYLVPPGEDTNRAIAIEGFRTTFKVERSLKKDPNKLELGIYNLRKETLSRIQKRHTLVELAAGYEGTLAQIFHGEAQSILPKRQPPDWVTQVMCGDGGVAYSYGRANQSFAPGTKLVDALSSLAKGAKIGLGNALDAFKKGGLRDGFDSFVHGFTASGDVQTDIDHIVRTAGFSWSIQDGQLQILRSERDTSGLADILAPDTGLIGSPEMGSSERQHGPALLKLKALLRPQIRPGVAFQVESESIRGQFRAEKVTHEGDTAAGDFYTTIEARAL